MIIEKLSDLTESEFEKLLHTISKIDKEKEVIAISLSKTSQYQQEKNEFILKTDKVYQDEFLKLTVKYA